MGPAEIERKLRQHDTDIAEIYPILGQIQGTLNQHTRRLDELGATLADHTTRLDGIDTTLAEHTTRFDAVDARFDAVDARFDRLEGTVQQILEIVRDRDTP